MKYFEKLPEKIKDVVLLTAVFPDLDIDDFLFTYSKYTEQKKDKVDISREILSELTAEFSYLLKTEKFVSFADPNIGKIILTEIVNDSSIVGIIDNFLKGLTTDKTKIKLIEAIVNLSDHGLIEMSITGLLEDKKATFKNMSHLLARIYKIEALEMKWLVVYFIERRRFSLESTRFLIHIVKTEIDFEIRWNAAETLKLFHTCKSFPTEDVVLVLIDDIEGEIRKTGFDILTNTKNIEALISSFKSIVDFKEDEIRTKAIDVIDLRVNENASEELFEALRLYAECGNSVIKSRLIQLLTNHLDCIGSNITKIISVLLSDEKSEIRIKTYDLLEKLCKNHPVVVVDAINRYGIKEKNFVVRKIIEKIITITIEKKIEEKPFLIKLRKLKEAIL